MSKVDKAEEAVATAATAIDTAVAAVESAFKIKKNITLPLMKPQIDVPVFIQVSSEMFVGKAVKKAGGGKDMEPATLVNCVNLETGEESQIIVPAVLKGIFEDEYPKSAYVGLGFRIVKHKQASGKKYHNFSVAELEL